MTAREAPPADRPRWEVLVSHHLPSRLSRTFAVPIGGRTYHFCARCTGQVVGLIAWVSTFAALGFLTISLFDTRVQVVFAILPLPAAIDWLTQASGKRESRNSLRFASGILLGAALTDLLASLVLAHWTILLAGILVLVAYLAGMLLTLKLSGSWKRVLRDHFPDVTLD